MRAVIVIPGHSSDERDWAIPVLRRLIARLAERHDVRVLALRYPFRRDRYTLDGVEVTALGWGAATGARRALLWADALRTLRRLHGERPFDLLHGLWADETGALSVWVARQLGARSVVSVLGGELIWLPDIRYGLQQTRFSRWLVGQALRADALIAPCDYVMRQIADLTPSHPPRHGPGEGETSAASGGEVYTKRRPSASTAAGVRPLAPDRVYRVPLGIDGAHFTPGGVHQPRRLFHVGSLIGVKDQPTLLRALALLDPDITLDIAGDGTDAPALRRLADALGVGGRVTWLGKVAHLDLPGHYRRAALHLMASRHETMPMSTLEAAACGTPTVGTAVGILPDDPALGVSVPVGDAEAMAAAIRTMLADPVRLDALRRSAREAVLSRYTVGHMVEGYDAVWRGEFSGSDRR